MSDQRDDSWTGDWAQRKIVEHDQVLSAELISPNLISVKDKKGHDYRVATMDRASIDSKDLEKLLDTENVDFILNVSKEPYITGEALEFAENHDFAIGGVGDLYRALSDHNLSAYVNPEVSFILRGLRQHTRVAQVIRLDSRRYQIERFGLPTVVVLALNDYELTAESVRSAIDRFQPFDAILKSNPNGGLTEMSKIVARAAGVKILRWGELMGDLNRNWT